jgi:xanthine dehydrogenase accessory factor
MTLAAGRFAGTVGGGCLEGEVQRISRLSLARDSAVKPTSVHHFALNGKQASIEGMICGGTIDMLVELVPCGSDPAPFRALVDARRHARRAVEYALVPANGTDAVRRRVVFPRGLPEDSVGSLGTPELDAWADAAAAQHVSMTHAAAVPCELAGSDIVVAYSVSPRPTAYVFGGGHCSQALAAVLPVADFAFEIFEDRAEFAEPALFASKHCPEPVTHVAESDPANPLAILAGREADIADATHAFVVILTRGHANDAAVLEAVLRLEPVPRYVGMIGSRPKIARVYAKLRAAGISEDLLERVHAPIGLPGIGGDTAGQISIAITAQLIQEWTGGTKRQSTPGQKTPCPSA